MRRRTWLQFLLALFFAARSWAQNSQAQSAAFPGRRATHLRALATAILPSALGREQTDRIADRFAAWVRGYRPGADLEHGYGFPRIRTKVDLPVARYIEQLDALGEAPTADAVRRALDDAKIAALPQSPNGAHIAADLLSFYFTSSDANDLCYQARIARDSCRGLGGSDRPPAPLA